MTEIERHCFHLDETDGMQCHYKGRHKFQKRGRPTCATSAFGDAQTKHGIVPNSPFLHCNPAIEFRVHGGEPQSEYTYDWLVEQQRACSKYRPKP